MEIERSSSRLVGYVFKGRQQKTKHKSEDTSEYVYGELRCAETVVYLRRYKETLVAMIILDRRLTYVNN